MPYIIIYYNLRKVNRFGEIKRAFCVDMPDFFAEKALLIRRRKKTDR